MFLLQPKIVYLEHIIDAEGLHPTDDKVTAIKEAPAPKDVTELRSFLGIIKYYHKFLPNLSDVLRPLYQSLCKKSRWTWGHAQAHAFAEAMQEAVENLLIK